MSAFVDITGQTIKGLKVIGRAHEKGDRSHWLCECRCGSIVAKRIDNLRNGQVHCKICKGLSGTLEKIKKLAKERKRRYNRGCYAKKYVEPPISCELCKEPSIPGSKCYVEGTNKMYNNLCRKCYLSIY